MGKKNSRKKSPDHCKHCTRCKRCKRRMKLLAAILIALCKVIDLISDQAQPVGRAATLPTPMIISHLPIFRNA